MQKRAQAVYPDKEAVGVATDSKVCMFNPNTLEVTAEERVAYPDKEALGVAGVLGPLPAGATAVAQLPAEHGA